MADWWLPEAPFAATATLTWRRTTESGEAQAQDATDATGSQNLRGGQHATGEHADEALSDRIPGVKWVVRGNAHWLTYQEPTGGRTTLVFSEHQLKWLRFGDITWQHTFTAGETTVSSLAVGGKTVPVRMETESLEIDMTPAGGRAVLVARMTVGETETLRTELHFVREDGADAEPTSD